MYEFEKIAGVRPSVNYSKNPKYKFEKIAAGSVAGYKPSLSSPVVGRQGNILSMNFPSLLEGSPIASLIPGGNAAATFRVRMSPPPQITRLEDLPKSSMKDKAFSYMNNLDQQGGNTSSGIRTPGFGQNASFPVMYQPYVQPWQKQAPPLQKPVIPSNAQVLTGSKDSEIANRARNQIAQEQYNNKWDTYNEQQAQRNEQYRQWQAQRDLEEAGQAVKTYGADKDNITPAQWVAMNPLQRGKYINQTDKQRYNDRVKQMQNSVALPNVGGMLDLDTGNFRSRQSEDNYNAAVSNYDKIRQNYINNEMRLRGDKWRANGRSEDEINKWVGGEADKYMESHGLQDPRKLMYETYKGNLNYTPSSPFAKGEWKSPSGVTPPKSSGSVSKTSPKATVQTDFTGNPNSWDGRRIQFSYPSNTKANNVADNEADGFFVD